MKTSGPSFPLQIALFLFVLIFGMLVGAGIALSSRTINTVPRNNANIAVDACVDQGGIPLFGASFSESDPSIMTDCKFQ